VNAVVVNIKGNDYDEYIGRGSIFGNPYEIGIDGTRSEVIARYEKWFKHLLKDPIFRRELAKLKGKKLGCFCHPLRCHGEIIVKYLNETFPD